MGRRKKEASPALFISPAAVQDISTDVFGEKWREGLGEFMGISYSQIHRYMTLDQDVPKVFALALVMLKTLKEQEIPFPTLEEYSVARDKAEAVRFIPTKKEKPAKVTPEDAPPAEFSFGDDETAPAPVVEQEKPPTIVNPVAERIAKPKAEKPAKVAPKAKATKAPAKVQKLAKAAPKAKATTSVAAPAETKAQRDARKKREKRAAAKAAA